MTIGMYYTVPTIAIFYYLGTQHQINVNYYMFVYYLSGNFVFGFILYIPICMFIDRPIYAHLNLRRDVKDAERHEDYKLVDYLDNFRPELDDSVVDPAILTRGRLAEAYAEKIKKKE